jgi:tRNA U34 5-carboxymethylaminomethyl modifying GTPase MnmE/TrmE
MERAMEAARSADLILNVRALNEPENDEIPLESGGEGGPHYLEVGTKADLSDSKQFIGKSLSAGLIVTSTRTGQGLDELVKVIIETLIPEAREPTDCFVGGVPITSEDLDVVKELHEKIKIYSRDL